ncbi:hypothetical protein ORN12_22330, partial [Pantoea vagans]
QVGAEGFKDYAYSQIALKINIHLSNNPEARKKNGKYDFVFYSVFHDIFMKAYQPSVFKKESAIYTVLLDRIINSDSSTKEALIAVLDAKLDEDYFFFLNALQIGINDESRINRMVASSLPLQVPANLSERIHKFWD